MDFRFTEDQMALRDHVRSFLADAHPPERLRALDAAGGRDEAVWASLVELGLPGLVVPEAQGGLGMSFLDATLIGVELGRANVSEPLADTAFVAAPWLARRKRHDPLLTRIASGEARVAVAHEINPWVADLDGADAVIAGGAIVDRPVAPKRINSVDPLRRLFAFSDAGGDDLLLDLAALTSAAQLVGAAEHMLEMASDYAKTREQFGLAIGAFQAIKHHLANVALGLEFARPPLWRAACALEDGNAFAPLHVSAAKVAASDAALLAAETAIQVHGAMGYTYEVDLHYWMKRAWALNGAWGDRAFHLKRVDDAVIGAAIPLGPDATFLSEANNA
jgi:alkylation response protein AidB-like acyl-CoA dehydrogenase